MKKIIASGFLCSMLFIASANAESIPSAAPEKTDPTSVKDVIKDELGVKKGKRNRPEVSDAVKQELKEYKAKKKALYDSLSPEAKKAMERHHKKRGHFDKTQKKKFNTKTKAKKDVSTEKNQVTPTPEQINK